MASLRAQVLKSLISNGRSMTRQELIDDTGIEGTKVSGVLHQLTPMDCISRHGEARDRKATFEVTDKGREYYENNKDNPSTQGSRRKSNGSTELQTAPIRPNISFTAESLTDQISAVLAENAEYRQALVDVRSRINKLLGEEVTQDEDEVIQFGGD